MVAVKSSNIDSVEHSGETLTVTFKSGHVYEYSDVPASMFEDMIRDASPGSYLHRHIKDRYPHRRVT